MIQPLTIVDGIIQDKYVDGIPVRIEIINPKGLKNVRTLKEMKDPIGLTIHNTGNSSKSAGDELHADWLQNVENADKQYISPHIFVDHDSITQVIPLDEVGYHAGDGKGDGNYRTIGIEICENINVDTAEENAKKLCASFMMTYLSFRLFKHQDWSGKYCPHIILDRKNGWDNFKEDVYDYLFKKKVKLVYSPEQLEDIIISTSKLMNTVEIIEVLEKHQKESEEPKSYSIEELQETMYHIGYDCGPFDGSPGPKTRAGFSAFQRLNGLKENGNMDPESIKVMEELKTSKSEYRTYWFNNSEVHAFFADLDKYEPHLNVGEFGVLEPLSKLDDEYVAAINGQFFGGGREGLGLLIADGLYYYADQHEKFANWLQFKDGHVELRDADPSEYWKLQYNTYFSIGTSWPLIIGGEYVEIKDPGIIHYDERHPRSLLAHSAKQNTLCLIAIDGRRSDSRGMTAEETQEALMYIAEVEGIEFDNATNLDGGGSTEMTVEQEIVNKPSDGHERSVGSIIGLKRKDV
ncbi:hypothetical protein EZV73_26550 [Acidaminobacter sp. JC074]|uniref:phosphodiester glycosidase family protein n=1 Tax=Acidaminobacter sp. JC074 TaxID=2530199 RepID=UPI001F10A966|nr:phosphodiester glycosidase family protein [Acidaminobacter sp. JC074]MCH4891167.1 hypothetical protein [Acidaminobacter sp. JC074]